MIISIALVICSALVLLLLIRLARGQHIVRRRAENPAEQLRFVDLESFRNLIDPTEEQYLRSRLLPEDFRKVQRERIQAAIDYIGCAAHDAGVLLNLAEAAHHSSDPEIAAMATRLTDNALRLRIYAWQAIAKLYLALLLPSLQRSHVAIADRYETMVRHVVLLGLRYPVVNISSAL
jgi:hypothetical protein